MMVQNGVVVEKALLVEDALLRSVFALAAKVLTKETKMRKTTKDEPNISLEMDGFTFQTTFKGSGKESVVKFGTEEVWAEGWLDKPKHVNLFDFELIAPSVETQNKVLETARKVINILLLMQKKTDSKFSRFLKAKKAWKNVCKIIESGKFPLEQGMFIPIGDLQVHLCFDSGKPEARFGKTIFRGNKLINNFPEDVNFLQCILEIEYKLETSLTSKKALN